MKKIGKTLALTSLLLTFLSVFMLTGCGPDMFCTVHLTVKNEADTSLFIDYLGDESQDMEIEAGKEKELAVMIKGGPALFESDAWRDDLYISFHYFDREGEKIHSSDTFSFEKTKLEEEMQVHNIASLYLLFTKESDKNGNAEYRLCKSGSKI